MADLFQILNFQDAIVEGVDITTTHPDWTDLLTLQETMDPGRYLLGFSLQFNVGSTRSSFIYQFSTDGGSTWGPEYYKEVKDKTNTEVLEVFNIVQHGGGSIDIRCRVTREAEMDCHIVKGMIFSQRVR